MENPTKERSILQVNTGGLESVLNSLKKQLARHEDELLHPVWWDSMKAEVDKISGLGNNQWLYKYIYEFVFFFEIYPGLNFFQDEKLNTVK